MDYSFLYAREGTVKNIRGLISEHLRIGLGRYWRVSHIYMVTTLQLFIGILSVITFLSMVTKGKLRLVTWDLLQFFARLVLLIVSLVRSYSAFLSFATVLNVAIGSLDGSEKCNSIFDLRYTRIHGARTL